MVGVKAKVAVPDSVAPGAGAVTEPGSRRSTTIGAVADVLVPDEFDALSATVYSASGAGLPPSSRPSQLKELKQPAG